MAAEWRGLPDEALQWQYGKFLCKQLSTVGGPEDPWSLRVECGSLGASYAVGVDALATVLTRDIEYPTLI